MTESYQSDGEAGGILEGRCLQGYGIHDVLLAVSVSQLGNALWSLRIRAQSPEFVLDSHPVLRLFEVNLGDII